MQKPVHLTRPAAILWVVLLTIAWAAIPFTSLHSQGQGKESRGKDIMWINHLSFLPGDPSVQTSFNAVSSGVGSGLSGLVIQSSTLGDTGKSGGNKVVETAVEVPPRYKVTGLRVCYENSNPRSFITQVRLAQVQDPPSSATVLLDDPAHLNASGPVCVNSKPTSIDPSRGALLLSLRVNFGNTADKIVVRGVALHLAD